MPSKEQTKATLREHGLRVTAPRVAVLQLLQAAEHPLSFTEVAERLGSSDWDRTTVYRNLVKLSEIGISTVVTRANGIDRYAVTTGAANKHRHAHFSCGDCGRVACLPDDVTASITMEGPWAASIERAMIQLQGACPDCLEPSSTAHA